MSKKATNPGPPEGSMRPPPPPAPPPKRIISEDISFRWNIRFGWPFKGKAKHD